MKKVVVVTVIFVVGLFFGYLSGKSTAVFPAPVAGSSLEELNQTASLMLDFGDGHVKVYSEIPVVAGETLIHLLEKQAKTAKLDFTVKKYDSLGVLVETIGDKTNGEQNKYWQYWVNNQSMPYGADQYKVQPGDVIEWKFLNYK